MLVVGGEITAINTNLTTLNTKTTEMSFVPNFGTYFHNLSITDGVSDFIKFYTDGTSLFKNDMTFRRVVSGQNVDSIVLRADGTSRFTNTLTCDTNIICNSLNASNSITCSGYASITSTSTDGSTSIFAVNDNLNNVLLNVTASNLIVNKNAHFTNTSLFDKTLSFSQDTTLLTDIIKLSKIISGTPYLALNVNKDGNLFTYNNTTLGNDLINNTTTLNSVLQCNGVSNLKETHITDRLYVTNTSQSATRNIMTIQDNAVDILKVTNAIPSNNNVSNIIVNAQTNLTSTNANGNILVITTGAGQNIMIVSNDGGVTIYNNLTIGSGTNTPLVINAPTTIKQSVTIGTQTANNNVTIYGDVTIGNTTYNNNLKVYGNLEVYGNMRCTGTFRCANLVVDNQVQLPQQPTGDMEFGAWVNQVNNSFDNSISGILNT